MPSLTLNLTLDEDRLTAMIEAVDPSGLSVSGAADAADLDELIRALGAVRAAMADAVPETLEPPARIATLRDPAWWCEGQPGVQVLCLRHPGFGWQAFALAQVEAELLAERLLEPYVGDE
ncbi:hypothetical protein [Phenylobacterium deserti]|uniref:Uncharacterized protein n=1 Tax=Phenylobacterium deserti TaxID=1914756 RepID=A0A328A9M1_9CAUL|nr:hypothetical protein [Phenylobacterium deserti]RAK50836.1 hypothetical protein DJ018_16825 [Phenylobacterium deserti]